jgi:hypothetical protein
MVDTDYFYSFTEKNTFFNLRFYSRHGLAKQIINSFFCIKNGVFDMAFENAKKKSSKKGGNGLIKILLAILILAVISIMISLFISTQKSKKETADLISGLFMAQDESSVKLSKSKENPKDKRTTEKKKSNPKKGKAIEGSWVSLSNGVTLTLRESRYTIDYSNVEGKKPMTGTYKVTDDKMFFVDDSESGTCRGLEGIYKYQLNEDNLHLESIDEECTKEIPHSMAPNG